MSGVGKFTGNGDADLHDVYALVPSPRHADSERLLAFWNSRGDDGIVMGRDVPSRAIANLLSHIMVWEPVSGGSDMKVRLAGAATSRRFAGDLKGRLMSEVFSPVDFAGHLQEARRVIDAGRPLIVDSRVYLGKIERMHLEVVLLPIRSPDRSHTWVMSGAFFFD